MQFAYENHKRIKNIHVVYENLERVNKYGQGESRWEVGKNKVTRKGNYER